MSVAAAPARRLGWDSAFFGFPVAQGEPATAGDVVAIDLWADIETIRCVYLLVPAASLEVRAAAESRGFSLTGIRVTCTSDVTIDALSVTSDAFTVRPAEEADVPELERIAASSHSESRFYADGHFSRDSCESLYRTWIRRSCEGWADGVLVADLGGQPQAYISLHVRAPDEGAIGLFAVASNARKMGIGRALVRAGLGWFRDRQVKRVTVVTQAHNVAALRLYQRAGFFVSQVDLWFHKWR